MNDPRALPGEPLALDLADTEFVPDGTAVDLLATAESARAWAAAAGLAGTLDEAGLSALRQARSAIRDALEGRGTAPLNAVLDKGRVRLSVSDALAPARTLQAGEPAWQPAVLAAANLLDLLEAAPGRVKHCENPDCVLWFFDTTRNGTRRWCSMAACGNRMKARRHYDRVKARLPAQDRITCVRRCKQHTRAFSRPDSARISINQSRLVDCIMLLSPPSTTKDRRATGPAPASERKRGWTGRRSAGIWHIAGSPA